MNADTLLITIAPDGFITPWLFDTDKQLDRALAAFHANGIYPLVYSEGLWNDADEVAEAIEAWKQNGELEQYRRMNPPGRTT